MYMYQSITLINNYIHHSAASAYGACTIANVFTTVTAQRIRLLQLTSIT